jgi:peptide chain release factor 2
MSQPDFWDHQEKAQETITELKSIKSIVEDFDILSLDLSDEIELLEMCDEVEDQAHIVEVKKKISTYRGRVNKIELNTLFSGQNDARAVFLSIHAGSGGVEAMDWAEMLHRMYLRWLQANNYTVKQVDYLPGEEAGTKRVVLEVRGHFPFGYLKSEIGVHRLIRISPFDSNSRRQTSFASVDVIPEHDALEVTMEDKDLRVDTFSAGGPGGQHVNKTQSAIRITHIPSGLVVSCQNERSQMLNRKTAMRTLASRLYRMEEAKREAALAKVYGEKGEIAFGYQIRSYTMQPYTLVKDHRTREEMGNVQAVLDGEISPFIEAFLRWKERTY